MIRKGHSNLSLQRQCRLLSVSRSGVYYQKKNESDLNLKLMRLMDEHYLKQPDKGARRMHTWLTKDMGYQVSKNRIERLYYRVMGLRSLLPGRYTSKRNKQHKVYPYLLRDLKIDRVNQVWETDITYVPMKKGFLYLTAIIDVKSRYVVNWSLSNTMDSRWCNQCVQEAIDLHGAPEIINTDQGAQYTSEEFSSFVLKQGIKLSMDGKGRATDNAFIERLWRSVKYEKIYLNPPEDGTELHRMLTEYFVYYNHQRRHSSLEDEFPAHHYLKAA
jgi:putative transposase